MLCIVATAILISYLSFTFPHLICIYLNIRFQKLLSIKRLEQIESIKRIQLFGKYESKYSIIAIMFIKLFEVIASSYDIISGAGYIPGSDFPKDKKIQEGLYLSFDEISLILIELKQYFSALAKILENTALFGDILLRVPDVTHRILAEEKYKEWNAVIKWSIIFSNSTNLFDKKTVQLLDLVVQELGIVEKKPNYVNPYSEKEIRRVSRNLFSLLVLMHLIDIYIYI
ncbi:Coiled-coil domain-containing protein 134 [Nymphon striatum]|nr:Coiled-coil domain-containing protein 134 [Nymphon striatum]